MTAADWIFWGLVLAGLVTAAVRAHRQAKAREALEAELDAKLDAGFARMERQDRLIRARTAAMDRAMSDSCACETCGAVTGRRELVSLFDDATLACDACATILRGAA